MHFGATSLAIPYAETVSFSIYIGTNRIRQDENLKFNENLDDFELFVASTFGAALLFVCALCRALQSHGQPLSGVRFRSTNPGYGALCRFLGRLGDRLDKPIGGNEP